MIDASHRLQPAQPRSTVVLEGVDVDVFYSIHVYLSTGSYMRHAHQTFKPSTFAPPKGEKARVGHQVYEIMKRHSKIGPPRRTWEGFWNISHHFEVLRYADSYGISGVANWAALSLARLL